MASCKRVESIFRRPISYIVPLVLALTFMLPATSKAIEAQVVAIDQVLVYNQFGAYNPVGLMFALKRDVVPLDPETGAPIPGQTCVSFTCVAGKVALRADKRPRPIVLRVNEGDTLTVHFTNLLAPDREDIPVFIDPDTRKSAFPPDEVVAQEDAPQTRQAGFHINGLKPSSVDDDASYVGRNTSSLVAPGGSRTYTWTATKEGTYLVYSPAGLSGGEGDGGQLTHGLFGAVNVEPAGSVWYASQVTKAEMLLKTTFDAGKKIISPIPLLAGNEIIRTDLNAIIVPPSPRKSFREFTAIFHDELKTVQALPLLETDGTFHGVRDGFGINYGSSGLGAPILASRGMTGGEETLLDPNDPVGPAKDCKECKYEEFFLTAWAVGDPALQVKTAWTTPGLSYPRPANEFLYPDDPSNVHHSYIGDPVIIRNVHAGPKETHVFHLHAHQWLHNPAGDTSINRVGLDWWEDQPQGVRLDGTTETNSTYLDSQTISPGAAFTYNITYGGSGNRNLTAGDAIFHCHLYPHFAQGMWSLWRNHDVFEDGNRLLPDNSPIPAIMPIPGQAMAPEPGTMGNPGYPFFIAGVPPNPGTQFGDEDALAGVFGHRPPQPPLDIVPGKSGGLQRHRFVGVGLEAVDGVASHTTSGNPNQPFARELTKVPVDNVVFLGPPGADTTAIEDAAIAFHSEATHPSFTPEGVAKVFRTNGLGPQPGAPYANPCPSSAPDRIYKVSAIDLLGTQFTTNFAGWHDPQARIPVLDQDVEATLSGQRRPEPLFLRVNSNDCITFYHTNRTRTVVDVDDFQVYTPTDTIGQHIHLVKFDVTSSDGSANGWNYEDGTFAAGEIRERLVAINAGRTEAGALPEQLLPLPEEGTYQTTTQRWWADPLLNLTGDDRTIRTIFTHDHFAPSTIQQHGYYAALVTEPTGSQWLAKNGKGVLGEGRDDGGPTATEAIIITGEDGQESYREFLFAVQDFALLYKDDGVTPINPPEVVESISADDPGTMLINYRHEPIPLRISNGFEQIKPQKNRKKGDKGNLANVFDSKVHNDPFTPVVEAYQGDIVQVRVIQGAQEEQHVFSIQGVDFLHEPADPNSGRGSAQAIGISEQFNFLLEPMPKLKQADCTDLIMQGGSNGASTSSNNNGKGKKDKSAGGSDNDTRDRFFCLDHLYYSTSLDDLWNGMWGIMRAFANVQPNLGVLPNNQPDSDGEFFGEFDPIPTRDPDQVYHVAAVHKPITYNSRDNGHGVLHDPTGLVFALVQDVADPDGNGGYELNQAKLDAYVPQPLVLRANAGDVIDVTLHNLLRETVPDLLGDAHFPPITDFNANDITPSNRVSMNVQGLTYNPGTSAGSNVGLNPDTTVAPGESRKYRWFAGHVDHITGDESPSEYGAANIRDFGDIMKHGSQGLFAGFITEPEGASWFAPDGSDIYDPAPNANRDTTRAKVIDANILGTGFFREFVVFYQDGLNQRIGTNLGDWQDDVDPCVVDRDAEEAALEEEGAAIECKGGVDNQMDPEDAGEKAFNYRTEPFWYRLGFENRPGKNVMNDQDLHAVLSNTQVGEDPQTPIFETFAGDPVKIRLLQPDGRARQHAFAIHGQQWPHEPGNPNEFVIGAQSGMSVMRQFNINLDGTPGQVSTADSDITWDWDNRPDVVGDWLYRDMPSFQFPSGLWGILRVCSPGDISPGTGCPSLAP